MNQFQSWMMIALLFVLVGLILYIRHQLILRRVEREREAAIAALISSDTLPDNVTVVDFGKAPEPRLYDWKVDGI